MTENNCTDCGASGRNPSTELCEPCELVRDPDRTRRQPFPIRGCSRPLPWPLAEAARGELTLQMDSEPPVLEEIAAAGGWTAEELDHYLPTWRELRARFESCYTAQGAVERAIYWQVGYLRHLALSNPGSQDQEMSSNAGEVELLALFARLFGYIPEEKELARAAARVGKSQVKEQGHGIRDWRTDWIRGWWRGLEPGGGPGPVALEQTRTRGQAAPLITPNQGN